MPSCPLESECILERHLSGVCGVDEECVEMISNLEVYFFCLETGSHMADYVGIEPIILLPQPLACCDYRPHRETLKQDT